MSRGLGDVYKRQVIYRIKDSRRANVPQTVTPVVDMFAELSDDAIIEL